MTARERAQALAEGAYGLWCGEHRRDDCRTCLVNEIESAIREVEAAAIERAAKTLEEHADPSTIAGFMCIVNAKVVRALTPKETP